MRVFSIVGWILVILVGAWIFFTGLINIVIPIINGSFGGFYLLFGFFFCLLGGRLLFIGIKKLSNSSNQDSQANLVPQNKGYSKQKDKVTTQVANGFDIVLKIILFIALIGFAFLGFLMTIFGYAFRREEIFSEPMIHGIWIICLFFATFLFILFKKK
ncbi:hypothetical protein [Entomomonas asaccharolytica]|uniref:Uncharacterized protein n=1 Tax=Entomomonas asaccharolytica TaxID=2785331 RepID=A0A974NEM6_9GAMM|nr:hypothetical protein [Entomomonas asaccharolytica]QQP85273.1 hypothetical protein JHT90_12935 [Entomomonas asaccharolytica]